MGGGDYDIEDSVGEKEELPRYLLTTHKFFVHLVRTIKKSNSTIRTNDIQDIAIMKHRIAVLLIKKQITETCLQSVIGKLNVFEGDLIDVDRRVWPVQVQSMMATHRRSSNAAAAATTVSTTMKTNKENEQIVCENLLHQKLKEIDQTSKQYEEQLNQKQNAVIGFTSIMEDEINHYVQQNGIKPLTIKGNFTIASIKYNYQGEVLERKYTQEQPNEYQVKTYFISQDIVFDLLSFSFK